MIRNDKGRTGSVEDGKIELFKFFEEFKLNFIKSNQFDDRGKEKDEKNN